MTTVFICTATRTSNIKEYIKKKCEFHNLFIWNASIASLPHISVDYSKYTNTLLRAFLFMANCFTIPCQFTPLFNLHHLIFSSLLFGRFISIHLCPFSYGNIIFYLCPLFRSITRAQNKALVYNNLLAIIKAQQGNCTCIWDKYTVHSHSR